MGGGGGGGGEGGVKLLRTPRLGLIKDLGTDI